MRATGAAPLLLVAVLVAASAAATAAADLGDVRLAGGPSPRQGQLQVQVDGEWVSAFCQTRYTEDIDPVPEVVCRQLGFGGGSGLYFDKTASLPAGNGTVLTGSLTCNGTEASLADCAFKNADSLYVPDCADPDTEGAFFMGVVCAGAVQIEDLRLAGGPSASEGRVELRLTNSSAWGTLCSTWSTYSDATVARVICRELGFEPAQALARGGGIYGSGGLEPVAAGGCGGEEEALEECQLRLVSGGDPSPCPALGVSCNGSQTLSGVRLAGGPSDKQGRLEVQVAGNESWGGVCAGGWASDLVPLAQLACRSLGLSGGAVRGGGWYGAAAHNAIADLQCGSGAADLSGCAFMAAHDQSCLPDEALGVACEGAEDIREVRLAGGPTKYEGRVEVKLNGTWVAASGEIGGAGAAAVVCRQLGLAGGVTRGGNAYGGATPACAGGMVDGGCTPTVDYRDVSCKGTEASLSECSWTTRSMLAEALGVACDGAQTLSDISALRLASNSTSGGSAGRLEVQMSGQWGTVCRFEGWFNEGAAKVACAQLGFPGAARIVPGIDYSNDTSLPISITGVYCDGGEASLGACEFRKNSPENPTCDHAGDVGLVCSGKEQR